MMANGQELNGTGTLSLYMRPRNRNDLNTPGGNSDKIRCYIGGEWKPRSEFSTRQLEKYARSNAKPGNSNISCRAHSAQNRRELCCEGPCGSWHPLEAFSKSTRTRGKLWCLDCTEWQLSVEPGYTPYVPPAPADGLNNSSKLADIERIIKKNGEGRVEDWIDGTPSQAGDFEKLEIASQRSDDDLSSEVSAPSGRSLMDNTPAEILDGLPQALNAVNLGMIDAAHRGQSSTDSEQHHPGPSRLMNAGMLMAPPPRNALASTSKKGKTREWLPVDESTETAGSDASDETFTFHGESKDMGVTHSVSDTKDTTTAATAFDMAVTNVQMAPVHTFVANPTGTNTAVVPASTALTHATDNTRWSEAEFTHLRLEAAMSSSSEWARPIQRTTDFYTPQYVMNGIVQDPTKESFEKKTFADMDDDDSEDEC